jgi:hypothetical protein
MAKPPVCELVRRGYRYGMTMTIDDLEVLEAL